MIPETLTNKFEGINRAKPAEFAAYWATRPVHFHSLFKSEATPKNIKAEFAELKRRNLICAVSVSHTCRCKYCRKEIPEKEVMTAMAKPIPKPKPKPVKKAVKKPVPKSKPKKK